MGNSYYCLPLTVLLAAFYSCQDASKRTLPPETTVPASSNSPSQKVAPPAAATTGPMVAPDSAQMLASFIPAEYRLLAATDGDLNLDALPDKVLVLQKLDTDTTLAGDTLNRPLLLLLGQPNRRYRLAARNDRVVLCTGCGGMMGDPYQGITIKKGYFSVEHYGGSAWRWTHITTFKYALADKQWYLHREGGDQYHATDPDKVETHIETVKDFGRIAFPDYDYDKRMAQ